MIDTIRIKSPYISENIANIIREKSIMRLGIDLETNEEIYNITTKQLKNTWENSIMIRVEKDRESLNDLYYILVECSVHKLKLGHNIYDGFEDYHEAVRYLIEFIEGKLNIKLPNYLDWEVRRIDIAENFIFKNKETVYQWFKLMKLKRYPRRKPSIFKDNGLYFAGRSTTWKAYGKGDEFRRHDFKRIRDKDESLAFGLLALADRILRIEVEIKLPKLKYDFKNKVIYVKDITNEYINSIYDKETKKVIREGEEVKKINDIYEVKELLYLKYSKNQARSLYMTFLNLCQFGEEITREEMSNSTWYRHRNIFINEGITWEGTEISVNVNTDVPLDFTPIKDSKYILTNNLAKNIISKFKRIA